LPFPWLIILAPPQLAVLAVLIFFAGVVDALAGGRAHHSAGLLSLGLNPALVLGTNKLTSFIGTIASTANYQRRQRIALLPFLPVILASLAGAYLGARLTVFLDPRWLKYIMIGSCRFWPTPVHAPQLRRADRSHELDSATLRRRSLLIAFPIGAYDGFFGPGTGTFLALAFSRFCRYDLLGSTARAKFLNLASNAAAWPPSCWRAGSFGLGFLHGDRGRGGHYVAPTGA